LALLKLDPRRSRNSSTTGLDRGGARGRSDIVKNGSMAEQRPVNYSTSSSEAELQEEDELFNREFRDKLVQESNRKSRVDNAPEPSFSSTNSNVKLKYLSPGRTSLIAVVNCGGQNATPAAFLEMFCSRGRGFSSRGRTPATPPPRRSNRERGPDFMEHSLLGGWA